MTQLTLISPQSYPLKSLIESAIANELRSLQAGLRRTEARLRQFEAHYQLLTIDFIDRFENDQLEETLELAEWVGEYRLWHKLQEKLAVLKGISFVN